MHSILIAHDRKETPPYTGCCLDCPCHERRQIKDHRVADCDDYISKPIDPEEILTKIEKWAKKG